MRERHFLRNSGLEIPRTQDNTEGLRVRSAIRRFFSSLVTIELCNLENALVSQPTKDDVHRRRVGSGISSEKPSTILMAERNSWWPHDAVGSE